MRIDPHTKIEIEGVTYRMIPETAFLKFQSLARQIEQGLRPSALTPMKNIIVPCAVHDSHKKLAAEALKALVSDK